MSDAVLKITTDAKAVQEAILPLLQEILGSNCDESTKCIALEMVGGVVKVENITIQHCHLVGDKIVNMDEPTETKSGSGISYGPE